MHKVKPSSPAARNRMKSVRRSGTKAEELLRKALTEMGVKKYQVDTRPLPNSSRRADILFPNERVAVFVDGCFWHGCPVHGTHAKANAEFWDQKIKANKCRDKDTNRKLKKSGWSVLRVWEHENSEGAAKRIAKIVSKRRETKRRTKR